MTITEWVILSLVCQNLLLLTLVGRARIVHHHRDTHHHHHYDGYDDDGGEELEADRISPVVTKDDTLRLN
jgi:hypothetical protein